MIDERKFERFFRLVSNFIDQEMDFELMDEFEHDLEDEFCRCFFNTFQKTVELCHQFEMEKVPEELHISVMHAIQETAELHLLPSPKKRKKPKRRE